MNKITNVLVATDFSDGAAAALAQAVRIGTWHQASVRAVHVIDVIAGLEPEANLAAMYLAMQDGIIEDSKKQWGQFSLKVPGASGVTCEIVLDARVRGILGEAAKRGSDLLVLGASPQSSTDTGFGSLTAASVRHSSCDVLIVRQNQVGPFKRVLACVDFSPASLEALEAAVRVATQDSAQLHVIHAFRAPWQERRLRSVETVQDPTFRETFLRSMDQKLGAFVKPLEHELLHLKARLENLAAENHRAAIVQAAGEFKADLVVLGTRGKTNLRDVFLGSTAEKVLAQAPCSVLAVRPKK